MKLYIAVGIGGVIGTMFRYMISLIFATDSVTHFPWGTFIANMSGAYLLTWILFQPFIVQRLSSTNFVALTTGIIGSYTTFSTVILETSLLISHDWLLALRYLLLTVLGGLLASYAGYAIANKTNKSRDTSCS